MHTVTAMNMLRSSLVIVLALALMVTSGVKSLANSVPQGQLIEICSSDGVQLVTLDEHGEPTTAPPHCPDCVGQPNMALPVVQDAARWDGQMRRLSVHLRELRIPPQVALRQVARGPPAYAP